jgi:hypothetical protein
MYIELYIELEAELPVLLAAASSQFLIINTLFMNMNYLHGARTKVLHRT